MRIILFHSRGYTLEPASAPRINTLACIMPPIGLASLAAVLRQAGHQVIIFDAALHFTVTNESWARQIVHRHPDFVGFSTTTAGFLDTCDVCRKVKDLDSSIRTVFGGVHVSWGRDSILRDFDSIDYVIAGEGEFALRDLAAGIDPASIAGVYFRKSEPDKQAAAHAEKLVSCGPARTSTCNLDDLPFPAYDLLDGFPRNYLMPLFSYPHHPGANIVSSRGCVYQCSYCDRSVFGKSFRWNSPCYTIEQVRWLQRDFGIRHINFYDDLFTLNRARVAELCEMLSCMRPRISFNCIVRIDHVDRELIGLLKKGGCWMVSVGIESGDQRILDEHKDGLTLEAIRRDIELLYNEKLWVKGLFMMGFPGETEDSIVKTREFALSLPLKDANITAFTPFPGAPVSKGIEQLGEFENDWSKMDCVNFVFVSREAKSRQMLAHHYGEFYRQFYNRPFMRRHVYGAMALQSPHSFYRLAKALPRFLGYARSLRTGVVH